MCSITMLSGVGGGGGGKVEARRECAQHEVRIRREEMPDKVRLAAQGKGKGGRGNGEGYGS